MTQENWDKLQTIKLHLSQIAEDKDLAPAEMDDVFDALVALESVGK